MELLIGLYALIVGFFLVYFTRKIIYGGSAHKGRSVSQWSGFKKKPKDVILLETAVQSMNEGAYENAEKGFREVLPMRPEDPQAHLGLAECLFDQSIKGVRKNPEKKAEALQQYQWALDYYLRTNNSQAAASLYRRILGPYSREEIGERFKGLMGEYKG